MLVRFQLLQLMFYNAVDDSDRDSVEEEVFGPRLNEKDKEIKPLTRDESWRKDAPLREWDKEKEGQFTEKTQFV